MKVCNKCKIEKEEIDFAFRNKEKGILQGICRICKRIIDNNDYHREGRKISIRKAVKKLRLKTKDFIDDFKKNRQCTKCGDKRFYVLDFHHISNKEFEIAMAHSRGISKERLLKELDKCELLCANCHRELHYKEKLES